MQLKQISCFLGALISLSSFTATASNEGLDDMELVDILGEYDHSSSASPSDTSNSENINIYLSLQIYLSQEEPVSFANEHEPATVTTSDTQSKKPVPVHDNMLPEENVSRKKRGSNKKANENSGEDHKPPSGGVTKTHRTHWTKQEDADLMRIIRKQQEALKEGKKINWQIVTDKFLKKTGKKRTSKQLRERFNNHLDNVYKGPLNDALKNQILELQEEMGCSWSAIAKIINENRSSEKITPLCIKNFYYGYKSRAKKNGDKEY